MTCKPDEEIKGAVEFQLGWDSRIDQNEIGVAVRRGVVTLTGTVDSYAKKLAAQQASHRAAGVLDIVNEIEVKVPGDRERSDEDIARAARHALEWNVLVPSEKIHTTVMNGWITLDGDVGYYRERLDAEYAIASLQGVRGVTNRLQVRSAIDPERVKFLIEDVLELRADRRAHRMRIDVDGGVVTLTGTVNTWEEKKAILGAVSHAPGVRDVRDCLTVDPYNMHLDATLAG
ncbi:MAG: BON domain-containing protein [Blastocatellia bacterium]|nr:BON domain-containing protein [Blastocatellia bacterium]